MSIMGLFYFYYFLKCITCLWDQGTAGSSVLSAQAKGQRELRERSPKPCRYNAMVISKTYLNTSGCLSCLRPLFVLSGSFKISCLFSLSHTCPFQRDKLQVACKRQFLCFQPEENPLGGRACSEGIQLLERSSGFSLYLTLPEQGDTSCVMPLVPLFICQLEVQS